LLLVAFVAALAWAVTVRALDEKSSPGWVPKTWAPGSKQSTRWLRPVTKPRWPIAGHAGWPSQHDTLRPRGGRPDDKVFDAATMAPIELRPTASTPSSVNNRIRVRSTLPSAHSAAVSHRSVRLASAKAIEATSQAALLPLIEKAIARESDLESGIRCNRPRRRWT